MEAGTIQDLPNAEGSRIHIHWHAWWERPIGATSGREKEKKIMTDGRK